MAVVHKKSPLSSESKERLLNLNGYESTDIKVDPGNWTLPNAIDLEKIKNFTSEILLLTWESDSNHES